MSMHQSPNHDGGTFTIRIPLSFRRKGGRKQIVSPDRHVPSPRPSIDSAMIKAVVRAHRWKRMLEGGDYTSIAELAAKEKINESYLCRVLRLTLLAPDIIEAILDGRQPADLLLDALFKPFPNEWDRQRNSFGV